jgi:acyl-CoA thioester hydrolase
MSVRDEYPYWADITTRWADNDMYGHVNNIHYYAFFDTVLTQWLIAHGGHDPAVASAIGLCVESKCEYRAPLSFPDTIAAGLRIGRLGRSSVRYEIVLLRAGADDDAPAAEGHFVHVYVDRVTRRPVPVPAATRDAMGALCTSVPHA